MVPGFASSYPPRDHQHHGSHGNSFALEQFRLSKLPGYRFMGDTSWK